MPDTDTESQMANDPPPVLARKPLSPDPSQDDVDGSTVAPQTLGFEDCFEGMKVTPCTAPETAVQIPLEPGPGEELGSEPPSPTPSH